MNRAWNRRLVAAVPIGYALAVRRGVHSVSQGTSFSTATTVANNQSNGPQAAPRANHHPAHLTHSTPAAGPQGSSPVLSVKVQGEGTTVPQLMRLFASYGAVDIREQPWCDTVSVGFNDADSAALALEQLSGILQVEYGAQSTYKNGRSVISADVVTPITFGDALEWCKRRKAKETAETCTHAKNTSLASRATPVDYFCFNSFDGDVIEQLFPREGSMDFVELLRRDVRQKKSEGEKEAHTYLVPVRSVYWAMVADMKGWTPLIAIQDLKKRRRCIERRLKVTFGITEARALCAVASGSRDLITTELYEIASEQFEQRRLDEPLVEVLDKVIDKGPLQKIPRDQYTKDSEWVKVLPPYWVSRSTSMLKRGGYDVFSGLIQTETLLEVMNSDVTAQMLLIGGESGAGKTCALLSAGAGHTSRATHHLHLIDSGSSVFPSGMSFKTSEDVLKQVRAHVHGLLTVPLAMTSGNADKELRVLLYMDEAAANIVQGRYSESDVSCYMRELIRGFHQLRAPTLVGEGDTAVKLGITVVAAGTGLEDMYGGDGGSIGGLYKTVLLRRPAPDSVRLLVNNALCEADPAFASAALVDEFLAPPGVSVIACSNMRFLAFTLRILGELMKRHLVRSDDDDALVQQFRTVDLESGALRPQTTAMLLRRLLPTACNEAAARFIEANGLKDMKSIKRQLLLRAAHVAYLKRVVLVSKDAGDDVDRELIQAGFTPVRRPREDKDKDKTTINAKGKPKINAEKIQREVSALLTASAAGIFSTTKIEGKPNDKYVRAGAVRQGSDGRQTGVVVPKDQPPIVMSAMYRVLARVHDNSFPCDVTPESFESLMTLMLCESLEALAVHEGGCTRQTLRAAVCSASLKTVWRAGGTPSHRDDEWVEFAHAVHVRLNFRLGQGEGTAARIRSACAAALKKHLKACVETLTRLRRPTPTSLATRLTQLKNDMKRDMEGTTLPKSMHHVMFVLTPLPQSPSPDTVVLCAAGPDKGYLATDQYKCLGGKLKPERIPVELAKSGIKDDPKKEEKKTEDPDSGTENSDVSDVNSDNVPPETVQRGEQLLSVLESLADVKLCETFFGLYQEPPKYTLSNYQKCAPIYLYQHESLHELGYKLGADAKKEEEEEGGKTPMLPTEPPPPKDCRVPHY